MDFHHEKMSGQKAQRGGQLILTNMEGSLRLHSLNMRRSQQFSFYAIKLYVAVNCLLCINLNWKMFSFVLLNINILNERLWVALIFLCISSTPTLSWRLFARGSLNFLLFENAKSMFYCNFLRRRKRNHIAALWVIVFRIFGLKLLLPTTWHSVDQSEQFGKRKTLTSFLNHAVIRNQLIFVP